MAYSKQYPVALQQRIACRTSAGARSFRAGLRRHVGLRVRSQGGGGAENEEEEVKPGLKIAQQVWESGPNLQGRMQKGGLGTIEAGWGCSVHGDPLLQTVPCAQAALQLDSPKCRHLPDLDAAGSVSFGGKDG